MVSNFPLALLAALLPLLALSDTAPEQRARVERLQNAVLAPCCYAQPVGQHQSEIAVKMRLEIAEWVAAGKSDQEILSTYVRLYGPEVLVDPRTVPHGWLPLFPWLALILGLGGVFWLLKRWRRPRESAG